MSESIHLAIELHRPDFTLSVDLCLPDRGVTAIYGHSGSGKTSLLRCVAGLEPSAACTIDVRGETWENRTTRIPTHRRDIGYVFQEASLLEHLNVLGNLSYGMKRARITDKTALKKAIDLLGIGHTLKRSPSTLSGGERQRVSIARALALSPQVLLMDEPLSALDLPRKKEVLPYLERLHRELEIPVLYVTHSVDEVITLADHVVLLENGRVKSEGPIHEVISGIEPQLPTNEGTGVVIGATVTEKDSAWNMAKYAFSGGAFWGKDMGLPIDESVRVRVLSRDVFLSKNRLEEVSILNQLPATIHSIHDSAHQALIFPTVTVGEEKIIVQMTKKAWHELGMQMNDHCWVHVKSVTVIGCGF